MDALLFIQNICHKCLYQRLEYESVWQETSRPLQLQYSFKMCKLSLALSFPTLPNVRTVKCTYTHTCILRTDILVRIKSRHRYWWKFSHAFPPKIFSPLQFAEKNEKNYCNLQSTRSHALAHQTISHQLKHVCTVSGSPETRNLDIIA